MQLKTWYKALTLSTLACVVLTNGLVAKSDKDEIKPIRALTCDIEQAYQKYYKAKQATEEFEKSVETARKEVNAMKEECGKMYAELQELSAKTKNPALSEDAKKKLENDIAVKTDELRKKGADTEQYEASTSANLQQQNQEIVVKYVDEIKKVIATIAEEKKADMVFSTSGLGVLYAHPNSDITTLIVERLNADEPKNEVKK